MTDLPLRHSCRALLVDGDRILLARHRLDDYAVWAGPGGGVEPGETHVEALARELHEETGLILADPFGAEIQRMAPLTPLAGARRNRLIRDFGRAAALRLHGILDPASLADGAI